MQVTPASWIEEVRLGPGPPAHPDGKDRPPWSTGASIKRDKKEKKVRLETVGSDEEMEPGGGDPEGRMIRCFSSACPLILQREGGAELELRKANAAPSSSPRLSGRFCATHRWPGCAEDRTRVHLEPGCGPMESKCWTSLVPRRAGS